MRDITNIELACEHDIEEHVEDVGELAIAPAAPPAASAASSSSAPPVGEGEGVAGEPASSSAAALEPSASKAKQQAKENIEEKRAASNGQLDLCCRILCNDAGLVSLKMQIVCARGVRAAHSHHLNASHTQKGGLQWWADMCAGAWQSVVIKTWKLLTDPDLLAEIGFSSDPCSPLDPDFLQQKAHATCLLRYITEIAKHEINDGREYEVPPLLFGGLNDDSYAPRIVEQLSSIWEALQALEEQMQSIEKVPDEADREKLFDFWTDLGFPSEVWAREVCIAAMENKYELPLPEPIRTEIRDIGRCPKGSALVENLINDARLSESPSCSKARQMFSLASRSELWRGRRFRPKAARGHECSQKRCSKVGGQEHVLSERVKLQLGWAG